MIADFVDRGTPGTSGGIAVYKARSLLYTYNDSIYFNNEAICPDQGVFYRLGSAESDTLPKVANPVRIYPNPSRGLLTIDLGETDESRNEMKLYNMLGQVILSQSTKGNQNLIDFQAKALAQGIYTLQIHFPASGRTEYQKLIYAP